MQVKIVELAPVRVAALMHNGSPALLRLSVERFIAWRKSSGLSPVDSSRTFGVPYGNPDTTPPEEFRFAICGEITAPVPANAEGIEEMQLAGGRCAVVRHVGSTDLIGDSIYPVFRDWLPGSGETLREAPLVFHYLSIFPETPTAEWQTDIYIPLAEKQA